MYTFFYLLKLNFTLLHFNFMMQTKQELLDSLSICVKRGTFIDYKKFLQQFEKGYRAKIEKKTGFKQQTMYDWLISI